MTFEIHHPAGIKFVAGSPGEALAIMDDPGFSQLADYLKQSFGNFATLLPSMASNETDAPADETSDTAEPVKRRGRRSRAQIAADEAAAAAALAASGPTPPALPTAPGPAPTAPVVAPPGPAAAPAPAPVPEAMKGTGTDGLGLPPFLDRSGQPAPMPAVALESTAAPAPAPVPAPVVAAPPPPLPTPPSPPGPPKPILGPKVAEKLLASKSGLTDGGKAWLGWLCQVGVIPDAEKTTFDEAMTVITLTSDAAIKPVADHLGVTA